MVELFLYFFFTVLASTSGTLIIYVFCVSFWHSSNVCCSKHEEKLKEMMVDLSHNPFDGNPHKYPVVDNRDDIIKQTKLKCASGKIIDNETQYIYSFKLNIPKSCSGG